MAVGGGREGERGETGRWRRQEAEAREERVTARRRARMIEGWLRSRGGMLLGVMLGLLVESMRV